MKRCITISSPASVPCSVFLFFFVFAEVRPFLVVKKKTARTVITFQQERIVSEYSRTSTLGTEESGHCKEVAVVERLKKE